MKAITPILVNNQYITNRVILPAIKTGLAEDGNVTEEMIQFYRDRTGMDHVGIMIVENAFVSEQGRDPEDGLSITADCDMEMLSRLPGTIHDVSMSRMLLRIGYAGVDDLSKLSREDIGQIRDEFAAAAGRAEEAGFDGVEIHAAHGALLNQFYSPLTNNRTDEYGADTMENRLRLLTEIIGKIRETTDEKFIIAVHFGASDYQEGGATVEEAAEAAKLLEEAGADVLDISGGLCGPTIEGRDDPGFFKDASALVKESVDIPVFTAGGVRTAEELEALLQEEVADMIGVGTAMAEDPKWAWRSLAPYENQLARQSAILRMFPNGENKPK